MATAKKMPSGNYRVLVFVGFENGKRKYKSFTAPTKKAAEYAAAQWQLTHTAPTVLDKLTLGEAYDRYIESVSNTLSPSTLREYKSCRRNDFPDLMDLKLEDITQERIQISINNLASEREPKTVRNKHGLLAAVLHKYKPELRLDTILPKKKKTVFYVPSEQQIRLIYDHIKDSNIEIPFLLASQLGLRASEIAGLQYKHIDYTRMEIRIEQALVRGEDGNVLKTPKSYAGYRTLPCSKFVLDRIGPAKNPAQSVVGASGNEMTKRWFRALHKIETEYFNFHALRHYFASQGLLQGIPIKYLTELMGHNSEKMIQEVYGHTFPEAKQEFALRLAQNTERIFANS